jgi:glycerophosphoryl diester phosphodiesterase
VRLTADGALVLAHDPELGRPDRFVERLQASEVAHLPTLAAAFAALPAGFPVNLDVKRDEAPRAALARAVVEAAAGRAVLVSSFDWPLLEEMRRLNSTLPLALLADDEEAVKGLAEASARLEPWAWCVVADHAVSAVRTAGSLPVLAYTVNDPARARELFEAGVAGVFTDQPRLLRERLRPD